MISRLLRPPRLRHATWMELFYDLVFVVAVSALGGRLSDDYSPAGILQFVGLFVPVWWAGVGQACSTPYTNGCSSSGGWGGAKR